MTLSEEERKKSRDKALAKAQASGFGQKGVAGRPKEEDIRSDYKWSRLSVGLPEATEAFKKKYRKDNGLPPDWNPDPRTPAQQKRQDTIGVVYFLLNEETNAVKVGWSSRLKKRMAALQGANSVELKLIGTLPNKRISDEQELHKQFVDHRIRNEWFEYTEELATLIDELLETREQE